MGNIKRILIIWYLVCLCLITAKIRDFCVWAVRWQYRLISILRIVSRPLTASFQWDNTSKRALLLYGSVLLFFTYQPMFRQHELLCRIIGCHYKKWKNAVICVYGQLHLGCLFGAVGRRRWGQVLGSFPNLIYFWGTMGRSWRWHRVSDSSGSCRRLTNCAAPRYGRQWFWNVSDLPFWCWQQCFWQQVWKRNKSREEGENAACISGCLLVLT